MSKVAVWWRLGAKVWGFQPWVWIETAKSSCSSRTDSIFADKIQSKHQSSTDFTAISPQEMFPPLSPAISHSFVTLLNTNSFSHSCGLNKKFCFANKRKYKFLQKNKVLIKKCNKNTLKEAKNKSATQQSETPRYRIPRWFRNFSLSLPFLGT